MKGFWAGYNGTPIKGRSKTIKSTPKSSTMVRCESCGTFVLEDRAMKIGGRKFCSSACMECKARLINERPA